MQWFPDDVGFMTSITLCGYGFGGVIWNPLETSFVNPDNVSPDYQEGSDLYVPIGPIYSFAPVSSKKDRALVAALSSELCLLAKKD